MTHFTSKWDALKVRYPFLGRLFINPGVRDGRVQRIDEKLLNRHSTPKSPHHAGHADHFFSVHDKEGVLLRIVGQRHHRFLWWRWTEIDETETVWDAVNKCDIGVVHYIIEWEPVLYINHGNGYYYHLILHKPPTGMTFLEHLEEIKRRAEQEVEAEDVKANAKAETA